MVQLPMAQLQWVSTDSHTGMENFGWVMQPAAITTSAPITRTTIEDDLICSLALARPCSAPSLSARQEISWRRRCQAKRRQPKAEPDTTGTVVRCLTAQP